MIDKCYRWNNPKGKQDVNYAYFKIVGNIEGKSDCYEAEYFEYDEGFYKYIPSTLWILNDKDYTEISVGDYEWAKDNFLNAFLYAVRNGVDK